MDITFYSTTSAPNVVSKQLATIKSASGQIWDETSIRTPTITMTMDRALLSANYAYIPTFGRYYYITDIKVKDNKLDIYMRCDVLMSFNIRGIRAVVERQSTQWNLYLPDGEIQQMAYRDTVTTAFPAGFEAGKSYILTVAGG